MNYIGIIPARWASTRFPGKPLVQIGSKTMIQRVYDQAAKALDHVLVATDDKRIADEVSKFGGQVVITGDYHKSGTDRCAEAVKLYESKTGKEFDVVINIQGDEPFIQPDQIKDIMACFEDSKTQIATLIKKITSVEALNNPNNPKVVFNKNLEAIYFSRSVIPYVTNAEIIDWMSKATFYEHIGLYGFKNEILQELTKLPPSPLEVLESLEQNRWIENGYFIKIAFTEFENISIDTMDDLNAIIDRGGF
jgi:3-deoxy-manno-octulosonate cytidylyltransferase (CMP-KDO synthetase)